MPRMTADELRELVNKGFEAVSIERLSRLR